MKLKIRLARFNGTGTMASVENSDEREIEIYGSESTKPKAACLAAAKALREAAERFELLAQEIEPYQSKVHDRLNRAKLTQNAEVKGGRDEQN